jgi:hypothetical protein
LLPTWNETQNAPQDPLPVLLGSSQDIAADDVFLASSCLGIARSTLFHGFKAPDLHLELPELDKYEGYRNKMYKYESTKLHLLIDAIMGDSKGKTKLEDLMSALATDVTCPAVNAEMELLKKKLCMTISEFTPEFIAS